jgi:hypothetical protein
MRSVRIDSSTVNFLPVVKGLVSEEEAVTKAYQELKPDAIAVSISKEELAGLHNREDYDKYELSDLEIIYQAFLEQFGEVRCPPPAYVKALEISEINGTPILPLDMNDEVYTEAYCTHVKTTHMIQESFFTRRATRKRYDLSSPQAFAISWDGRVNKASGFRDLECAREQHMAEAVRNLAKMYRNVLAVVECERAGAVCDLLSPAGPDGETSGLPRP